MPKNGVCQSDAALPVIVSHGSKYRRKWYSVNELRRAFTMPVNRHQLGVRYHSTTARRGPILAKVKERTRRL